MYGRGKGRLVAQAQVLISWPMYHQASWSAKPPPGHWITRQAGRLTPPPGHCMATGSPASWSADHTPRPLDHQASWSAYPTPRPLDHQASWSAEPTPRPLYHHTSWLAAHTPILILGYWVSDYFDRPILLSGHQPPVY